MNGLKTWPNTYFERRRPSTDWLLSEKTTACPERRCFFAEQER